MISRARLRFLATGQRIDPDGPAPVFEVPIANPDNLQCLHYPHPQTGQKAFPPAAAGECPPRPADAQLAAADGSAGAPGAAAPGSGAPGSAAPPSATRASSGRAQSSSVAAFDAGDTGPRPKNPWMRPS